MDTAALKAAWRRGELAKRGISYDEAMAIPYLRDSLQGAVKAAARTSARHARRRAPYND